METMRAHAVMIALSTFSWALLGGLALVASLESLPAWGRWIPGHHGIALLVAVGVGLGEAPWWTPLVPWAAAWAADVAVFAYEGRIGLVSAHGKGWWRAGLDMDDVEDAMRRRPWRAFLLGKFSTKQRARIPSAAARARLAMAPFAARSLVACFVFVACWSTVGGAAGWAATFLPRGLVLAMAAGAFLLITAPGLTHRKLGRDAAWLAE